MVDRGGTLFSPFVYLILSSFSSIDCRRSRRSPYFCVIVCANKATVCGSTMEQDNRLTTQTADLSPSEEFSTPCMYIVAARSRRRKRVNNNAACCLPHFPSPSIICYSTRRVCAQYAHSPPPLSLDDSLLFIFLTRCGSL